jgi:ParB-like nuclease domain
MLNDWSRLEADRAFTTAYRARRRAAFAARLSRLGRTVCGLPVYDEFQNRRRGPRGVVEIPLDAIAGTTEPNRAAQFDQQFRPTAQTRCRWLRVFMAFHSGASLPPISVVQVGERYAIRDGHHRVSVAKALGVPTIPALIA